MTPFFLLIGFSLLYLGWMGRSRSRRNSIYSDQYALGNVMPSVITSSPVARLNTTPYRPIRSLSLLPIEDFRTYHPLAEARFARVVTGHSVQPLRVSRSAVAARRAGLFAPVSFSPHLSFAVPSKTIICIRRQRRREVLFATSGWGKGGRRRLRKYNQWSEIRCSRS